jgi:predicted PurR-regulated permease PerM
MVKAGVCLKRSQQSMRRSGSDLESRADMPVSIGARTWIIAGVVLVATYILWIVIADALSALVLLFTGTLIAVALRPFIDRLRKRMPFGAAVGIAFGVVILGAAGLTAVLIAPLAAELQRLLLAVPGYVTALKVQLAAVERLVNNDQFSKEVAGTLASSAGGAFTSVGAYILGGSAFVAALVSNAVLIFLLAVGWALSSDQLASFALSLLPPTSRSDWRVALDDIGERLAAYMQGIVINGAVVGVTMGGSLALLGVPYALLLGFVVAIFQAIPMVGAIISGPIVLLVVLATTGWTKMVIALAIFLAVQIVDQNVLSPLIFGQRVRLSFLLVIFSTVVGGMLLGIPGAFLAVPAAAALQVIVVQIVAPAIHRANEAGP